MKAKWTPLITGFLVCILFSVLLLAEFVPIVRLEMLLYDLHYTLRGNIKAPPDLVIAAIDNRSLEEIGQWPWSRGTMAQAIDNLKAMEAKVIMLDVIYSEPTSDDQKLAKSIRSAGNVLLPIAFDFGKENVIGLDPDVLWNISVQSFRNIENYNKFPVRSAKGIIVPVSELMESVLALGHTNMVPDRDGVLRWEDICLEYNGMLFPSIDLETVRSYLGLTMDSASITFGEGFQLGEVFIPIDTSNRVLINYHGPSNSFPQISISDVIKGTVNRDLIKDKIVLIGMTATGLYDLRVTPVSSVMTGIEKHANLISSILHGNYIVKASNFVNVLFILISGLVFSAIMKKVRAAGGIIAVIIFLCAMFVTGQLLFNTYGIWLDLSHPSLGIVTIYLIITAYRYGAEEQYSKQIRTMFSSYVTEKVVNQLIDNPTLAKLGGERREVTVMFSDIRDFTYFSETHTPEEVVKQLNEYLSCMTEIIFKWEGTLDKFIGDAIVVFWGAPVPQKNHALLALKCALNMIQKIEELQEKWKSENREPFRIGIGINTGEVLVGNMGAEGKKVDYTVIGDHVNLGSRVEHLTKKYNTSLLITEFTLEQIKEAIGQEVYRISVAGRKTVSVRGKKEPVTIYEVKTLGSGQESTIAEVDGSKPEVISL